MIITRYQGTSLLEESITAESWIHDPASLCFKKCCSAWKRKNKNILIKHKELNEIQNLRARSKSTWILRNICNCNELEVFTVSSTITPLRPLWSHLIGDSEPIRPDTVTTKGKTLEAVSSNKAVGERRKMKIEINHQSKIFTLKVSFLQTPNCKN